MRKLLALLLLVPALAWADLITGKVVGVHDGDTLTVLNAGKVQHKIRLAGIDAPELGQAYGQASKKHLAELVAGKTVSVEWDRLDKYRRIIGKVLLDGQDVCLAQITAGMAWHYKKYESEQTLADRNTYSVAEQEARNSKRGLWRDSKSVPPWKWRRSKARS